MEDVSEENEKDVESQESKPKVSFMSRITSPLSKDFLMAYCLIFFVLIILIFCVVALFVYKFESGYEGQLLGMIQSILFLFVKAPKYKAKKNEKNLSRS